MAKLEKTDKPAFNPWKMLAVGVLEQAVKDIRRYRRDPLRALEALTFLATEGNEFASVAGLPVSEDRWEVICARIIR